jgi:hypothetical protein
VRWIEMQLGYASGVACNVSTSFSVYQFTFRPICN